MMIIVNIKESVVASFYSFKQFKLYEIVAQILSPCERESGWWCMMVIQTNTNVKPNCQISEVDNEKFAAGHI